MYTLEEIQKRIGNIQDLESIVRTMKVLASISIRQYEKAVDSLEDYYHTTELGLQVALKDRAARAEASSTRKHPGVGIIVIGSDQGMCGQFNEQIAAYSLAKLNKIGIQPEDRSVLAVGLRAVARLENSGQPVDHYLSVPGSVEGIKPAVQDMLWQIEKWRSQEERDGMFLFHNQLISSSRYRSRSQRFWPINPARFRSLEKRSWPTRTVPIYTLHWGDLFSALLQQYLFVTLGKALAESLAAENTSRLLSMQVAERNIQEKVVELTTVYHQQRQNSITSELLDIISGFEILTTDSV